MGGLVEQFVAIPTFAHRDFADVRALLAAKAALGVRIAACVPTLNEAPTIARVIATLKRCRLLDDVAVMDSGSSDGTCMRAAEVGAQVFRAAEILPERPLVEGKGENLWKSLHALPADIFVYIDGDVVNVAPHFIRGLLGPLLTQPALGYVKGFYERPGGGGRVTELLVRPLLRQFFPELAELRQPLAGEYAARREVLRSLPFPCGYGVETAHLLDLALRGQTSTIAQVDLGQRLHRQRPLPELAPMSDEILAVVLDRLWRAGRLKERPALRAGPERPALTTARPTPPK